MSEAVEKYLVGRLTFPLAVQWVCDSNAVIRQMVLGCIRGNGQMARPLWTAKAGQQICLSRPFDEDNMN
eukprot:SAG31_NODE_8373_length_1464_cov_1.101832_2_plen_69_part_01